MPGAPFPRGKGALGARVAALRRFAHGSARRAPVLLALGASLLVAACQSAETEAPVAEAQGKSAALRSMERVATTAYRCWFQAEDPAFSDFSFANELNSFSGQPRFLVVPENDYGGRPLLVVQASGASGQVTAFGPLLQGDEGDRIGADIRRWSQGNDDCAARA
jgi:hypothetical protein